MTLPAVGDEPGGSLALFAVFDGHSGWQASHYLSRTLIPELLKHLPDAFSASALPQNASKNDITKPRPSIVSDEAIHTIIQNVFTDLDEKMINAPLGHLRKYEAMGSPERPHRRLPLETHARNVLAIQRAYSGSCAILACLDPAGNRIHVANTGDSRAVMGIWEPASGPVADGKGVWKTAVLSEDHTGHNPAEILR